MSDAKPSRIALAMVASLGGAPAGPTCGTCPVWYRFTDKDGTPLPKGQCRYSPPVVHVVNLPQETFDPDTLQKVVITVPTAMPAWPQTAESEWCGQHPWFDEDEIPASTEAGPTEQ